MVPNYFSLCCVHILGPLFRRHMSHVCSGQAMSVAPETFPLCHISHFKAWFSRIMRIRSSREIIFSSKNEQTAPFYKDPSDVRDIKRRLLSSVQKVVPEKAFCYRPRLSQQTWPLGLHTVVTDLKKRLDRATYCFRTQVFEAIGTILVGPNYKP